MKSNDIAIAFEHVRYCYGEVCAIQQATFEIKKNTLTALIGPNGGGKSTIIKLLAGVIKHEEGRVIVPGHTHIGYVSQAAAFDLTFPITVEQAVLVGTLDNHIRPFRGYSKAQKAKAEQAIVQVGLDGKQTRGINQLSGGQLERTMIARALASDAGIIVLDEPDSSLDVDAATELYELLNRLKKDKTILVASHRLDKILAISDAALFVNGAVTQHNDMAKLAKKYEAGVLL
ncbi:MAG: ATP-binding cassette domain-containing protein [Eubacteriales bacterium]